MSDKIVDFQAGKENQLNKRKEAKLDEMRQAFHLARIEANKATSKGSSTHSSTKKKRSKSKK